MGRSLLVFVFTLHSLFQSTGGQETLSRPLATHHQHHSLSLGALVEPPNHHHRNPQRGTGAEQRSSSSSNRLVRTEQAKKDEGGSQSTDDSVLDATRPIALDPPASLASVIDDTASAVAPAAQSERTVIPLAFHLARNVTEGPAPPHCGDTTFAPNRGACPIDCPYLAERNGTSRNVNGTLFPSQTCLYQCVAAADCGGYGKKSLEHIADNQTATCRKCGVPGCMNCRHGVDECEMCWDGYSITKEGQCESNLMGPLSVAMAFANLLFYFFACWCCELCVCRRIRNGAGNEHGLKYRQGTQVSMASESRPGTREEYPLSTNLMEEPTVGGPGLVLHMRFQGYILVWGLTLAAAYYIFSQVTGSDLLTQGMSGAADSLDLCILIEPYAEREQKARVGKLAFCLFAYLFTMSSSIVFALTQEFAFDAMEHGADKRMRNVVAVIKGLPIISGRERPEEQLAAFVEAQGKKKPVGVSIAWDYTAYQDQIETILEQDIDDFELAVDPSWPTALHLERPEHSHTDWAWAQNGGPSILFWFLPLRRIDSRWRTGMWQIPIEAPPARPGSERIKNLLEGLHTSDTAFVVFDSEEDRDIAVHMMQNSNVPFQDSMLEYSRGHDEPTTIIWENYQCYGLETNRNSQLYKGMLVIMIIIFATNLVFVVPFSYYVSAVFYGVDEYVDKRSWAMLTVFTVIQNQALHYGCDRAARHAGNGTESERTACYNILYVCSNTISVISGACILGFICYVRMIRTGAHTADGQLLEELTSIKEIIQSYPMQRALGNSLFIYCFPGTFLMPYVLEHISTIFSSRFSRRILRSYPEMRGRMAERASDDVTPLRLTRYADLIYHTVLASMSFFVAGGYAQPVFMALCGSHVYIYLYDHWRILRTSQSVRFPNQHIDRAALGLMIIPSCWLLAGCLFYGSFVLVPNASTGGLAAGIIVSLFVNATMHRAVLSDHVPHVALVPGKTSSVQYKQLGRNYPANWFSCNPVHILRSRHIYKHSPPVSAYHRGHEHLMWPSEAAGVFYQGDAKKAPILAAKAQALMNPPGAPAPDFVLPPAPGPPSAPDRS